ncbi:MAG TPA: hypothetical protein ENN67_01695 [Firmicutes bacterium]|nr:hypothetical protein [Bacillota bacterium]
MKRLIESIFAVVFLCFSTLGCAGSNPLMTDEPSDIENTPSKPISNALFTNTVLWGYFEIIPDVETGEIEIIPLRNVDFTANVVNFLNGNPMNMSIKMNEIVNGTGYTDIDINVTLKHPFPGMPQFDGYDVRGVFMGDGSSVLSYNPDIIYPVQGVDQFMFADPAGGNGEPDGYTRWFNISEFSKGGMPLLSYTPGMFASAGFSGTATLCPYRYFADGLGKDADLWQWLYANPDSHGVFSSGMSNTRNYYLRFPEGKGIKYGYAVVANWDTPAMHPSNAPEAVGCKIDDSSTLYFIDESNNGGNIVLDISLFNWENQPSAIIIESNILYIPYQMDSSEMIPIGGDEHFSTWHVEIPADEVNESGNEFFVIAQYDGFDYSNEFGTMNDAWNDPLCAYFRFDHKVEDEIPAWIHVTSPNGGEELYPGDKFEITWASEGLSGNVVIEYSEDDFNSDINLISNNTPIDSGSYLWDVPCVPSNTLKIRVSWFLNVNVNDISDDYFTIVDSGWAVAFLDIYYEEGRDIGFDSDGNVYLAGTHRPAPGDRNYGFVSKYNPCGQKLWHKAWGGTGHTQGYGLAVDPEGNSYIVGNFYGTTNFDPDNPGGPNQKTSVGGSSWDAWLVSFDTDGDFRWVRTWGGTYSDSAQGVDIDEEGGLYITGFYSLTVDFNPSGGDQHTSVGDFDHFLCKYDSDGNYHWARAWGGPTEDRAWAVATGGGMVYSTGFFTGSDVNFHPDGSWLLSSNGGEDVCLSAFDTSGNFKWAYNWGDSSTGIQTNQGTGVTADSSGNCYATGYFRGTNVNFDPNGSDLHSSKGANDPYVSVFDSDGNHIWAKTFGSPSNDAAEAINIDGDGNVYITGWFYGTAEFDPDGGGMKTSNGFYDCFLNKLDSDGNFLWVRTWGGDGSNIDRGFGVACDASNNVYTTGFFNGTNVNFAPYDPPCYEPEFPLTPAGSADAFLTKHFPGGCW